MGGSGGSNERPRRPGKSAFLIAIFYFHESSRRYKDLTSVHVVLQDRVLTFLVASSTVVECQ